MGIILHEVAPSPPVRAVKLCLAELDLEYETKTWDILNKAHMTPDFIEKNPQHTVPTLEDGDLIIWDSHAINAYLVSAYGKNDALYPKDPKVRALVDQRLHFDSGVLFPAVRAVGMKLFIQKEKLIDEDKQKLKEVYDFLEKFLEGKKFITGETYNIADFSVYTTGTTLVMCTPELLGSYPNLSNYLDLCKSSFKGATKDEEGIQALQDLLEKSLTGK